MSETTVYMIHFLLLFIMLELTIRLFRAPRRHSLLQSRRLFLSILLFGLHAVYFYLIYDIWTYPPDVPSVYGNLALIFMIPETILFVAFLIAWGRHLFISLANLSQWHAFASIMLSFIFLVALLQLQSRYAAHIVDITESTTTSRWWSWWRDIHKNSLYFNLFTYGIGTMLTVMISSVTTLFIKIKQLVNQLE